MTRGALTEQAYTYMRDGILRGVFPAGSTLAEDELAEAIGSSRTPVRHALQALLREGLVEVGARRQLIVRGFTPEHRDEIQQLREALESVSVRRACEVMEVERIDELRLNLLRQRRAAEEGRNDDFLDLDEEFHLQIAAGAGLPILHGFLGQLRGFVRVARLGAHRPLHVLLEVIGEHEEILDAVEARDARRAHDALIAHLTKSEYVTRQLAPTGGTS